MGWSVWGNTVVEAFDDAPALLGSAAFFFAVGALAVWSTRHRRTAARRAETEADARKRRREA